MMHVTGYATGEDTMTETELLQKPTLTIEEAARILRLSKNGCYAAIAKGHIPSVRIGRCIRVPTVQLRRTLGIDAPKP